MGLQNWPPMVTCICPTKNRRQFIPAMLKWFAGQSYEQKELIVCDDGVDSVEDLCYGQPNVRYIRLADPMSIGAKRNLMCSHAKGEVIIHWDDDDVYLDGYIVQMVEQIRKHDLAVTGMYNAPFVHRGTGKAFIYENHPSYAIGATLSYLKDHWSGHPFMDVSMGEDNLFQRNVPEGHSKFMPHANHFIATDHGANTSPRDYAGNETFDGSDLLKIVEQHSKPTKRKAK